MSTIRLLFPGCSTQPSDAPKGKSFSSASSHLVTSLAVATIVGAGTTLAAYFLTHGVVMWTAIGGGGAALISGSAFYVTLRCAFGRVPQNQIVLDARSRHSERSARKTGSIGNSEPSKSRRVNVSRPLSSSQGVIPLTTPAQSGEPSAARVLSTKPGGDSRIATGDSNKLPSALSRKETTEDTSVAQVLSEKPTAELSPCLSKDFPKYIFTRLGNLSLAHLLFYLTESSASPSRRNEIILWSFSQRKAPQGFGDTMRISREVEYLIHPMQLGFHKKEGYAVTQSGRDGIFIDDDLIDLIEPCTSYSIKNSIAVGQYADKKHMVQQPESRACVATCASMILLDFGVDYDVTKLYGESLSDDERLNWILNEYGYQLNPLTTDVKTLEQWTQQKGPILASADCDGLGGHQFIIDAINADKVTIRDPWHGWRITLKTSAFLSKAKDLKANGVISKTS